MLEGIINTQATSDVVLGCESTLAASSIATFVRPYGPCTQVDIELAARVATQPRTTSSFGFVYISIIRQAFKSIYLQCLQVLSSGVRAVSHSSVPYHTPVCRITLQCAVSHSSVPYHTPVCRITVQCAVSHSSVPYHTPV